MKGSTILRVEPAARIVWQEINFSPLREFRGLIYDESPMMNAGPLCAGEVPGKDAAQAGSQPRADSL